MATGPCGPTPWQDSLAAAALFAVDPAGLGGVALRALAGPVRDRWLAHLRGLLPAGTPLKRMPLHIGDDRLLGGLDLAATLQAGRPVAQRGLLAQCDGGVLLLALAERLTAGVVARLAGVLDRGEVQAEREGQSLRDAARMGVVAFDEGASDDEGLAPALADRLAFTPDLRATALRETDEWPTDADAEAIAAARRRLAALPFDAPLATALCEATLALGIASPRAAWLAWRTARAAAALRGASQVEAEDGALAARLVLAPRATAVPAPPPEQEVEEGSPPPGEAEAEAPQPEPEPSASTPPPDPDDSASPPPPAESLQDVVLTAAVAALPPALLAALAAGTAARAPQGGRAGVWSASPRSGRPVGTRRCAPRAGARLALVDTLRAAAPWQTVRRREAGAGAPRRVEVRADDFHVQRLRQRSATTTLFVIDASGSAALHRLAEAKGAVNLLLADCYVRRDSVAVLAFRGRGAELLLPPTRSLVRAKRSLSGLPGGGGTPLAAGIEAAAALARQVHRGGTTPVVVFLTDGRANVARDGSGGRVQAEADALRAARGLRAGGFACLLIDTSPQPAAAAQRLAAEMAAHYRALPQAGARALSEAVRGLQQPGTGGASPRGGRGHG